MSVCRPSKSFICRSVSAVLQAGLNPVAVLVSMDGSVRIDLTQAAANSQPKKETKSDENDTQISWEDVA
jgi:hypothetical protein